MAEEEKKKETIVVTNYPTKEYQEDEEFVYERVSDMILEIRNDVKEIKKKIA